MVRARRIVMGKKPHRVGGISSAPLRVAAKLGFCAIMIAGCDTTAQDRIKEFNREGTYLYGQGDFQAARENFEEALELKPGDPDLLYNIAKCFDRQGEWPKAETFYQQCLD